MSCLPTKRPNRAKECQCDQMPTRFFSQYSVISNTEKLPNTVHKLFQKMFDICHMLIKQAKIAKDF